MSYGEKGVQIFCFSHLHPIKYLKQRKWRKRIITAWIMVLMASAVTSSPLGLQNIFDFRKYFVDKSIMVMGTLGLRNIRDTGRRMWHHHWLDPGTDCLQVALNRKLWNTGSNFVQDGPSLESSSYLNVTLIYLGPWDPWSFGLLDLFPPPLPPHTSS